MSHLQIASLQQQLAALQAEVGVLQRPCWNSRLDLTVMIASLTWHLQLVEPNMKKGYLTGKHEENLEVRIQPQNPTRSST